MELPELPPYDVGIAGQVQFAFSAEALRSYAEEAVKQERERAASWLDFYDGKGKRRAEAIRAGDHHDFRARSEP